MNCATNPAIYIPGTCAGQPCSTTAMYSARRFLARLSPAGANIGPMSILDDGANSSYNALLLSVDRRLNGNFSMLLNYTFSHCLSDGDGDPGIGGSYQIPTAAGPNTATLHRSTSAFDASVIAMSPRFSDRWMRRFLGNWQASGIVTKRTGLWFNIIDGRDNSLSGIGVDRPDVVGNSHVANQTLSQWFNPAAFS